MGFRLVVFAIVLLIGACSQIAPKRPNNCAVPPSYFKIYGAPSSGDLIPIVPLHNTIVVLRDGEGDLNMHDRDFVEWNGTGIPFTTLDFYLGKVAQMNPQPATVLDFSKGVPCRTVKLVRDLMEKQLACSKSNFACAQGFYGGQNSTPAPQPTPH